MADHPTPSPEPPGNVRLREKLLFTLENLENPKLRLLDKSGNPRKKIPTHEISQLIAARESQNSLDTANVKEIEREKRRLAKAKSDQKRAAKLGLDVSVLPRRKYKDKRQNRYQNRKGERSQFTVGRKHFNIRTGRNIND